MRNGFAFVLHGHLPFVLTHGRWPHGADWVNEAAAETYVPMLMMMRRLTEDGVPWHLNIDVSPVLCEQLGSAIFHEEFTTYLDTKISHATENEAEFLKKGEEQLAGLARYWNDYYSGIKDEFLNRWHGNILAGFRYFEDLDHLELMTCGATHGYMPLLGTDNSAQAQIKQAVSAHVRHFGKRPRGIWLPECAYRPRYPWKRPVGPDTPAFLRKGSEEFLSENGIRYFIIDTHMLRGGQAVGIYLQRFGALKELWARYEKGMGGEIDPDRTPHRPYWVASQPGDHAPVAAFTRDPDTGLVVWSGEYGYPGDGSYLDFHKKHFPGGLRYWRVTHAKADLGDKLVYEPASVQARLEENSSHFVSLVRNLLAGYQESGGRRVLTAPFDAELYGHWWFEGVRWLELVLRKMDQEPAFEAVRLGDYLEAEPATEVVALPEGSWGQGGFHWIWFNDQNTWTWEKIYPAEDRMVDLARKFTGMEASGDARAERAREVVKQAARELLLLESSDWQFLISTLAARDYAELRVDRHAADFNRVAAMAETLLDGGDLSGEDREKLKDIQERDYLFPDIEPKWWAKVEYPAE